MHHTSKLVHNILNHSNDRILLRTRLGVNGIQVDNELYFGREHSHGSFHITEDKDTLQTTYASIRIPDAEPPKVTTPEHNSAFITYKGIQDKNQSASKLLTGNTEQPLYHPGQLTNVVDNDDLETLSNGVTNLYLGDQAKNTFDLHRVHEVIGFSNAAIYETTRLLTGNAHDKENLTYGFKAAQPRQATHRIDIPNTY